MGVEGDWETSIERIDEEERWSSDVVRVLEMLEQL